MRNLSLDFRGAVRLGLVLAAATLCPLAAAAAPPPQAAPTPQAGAEPPAAAPLPQPGGLEAAPPPADAAGTPSLDGAAAAAPPPLAAPTPQATPSPPPAPPVTAVAPVKPPPPTWGKLGVGFGLDWGFFLTPDGPNEYIRDWMHEQADIIIRETGTEQMLLNFVPKLAVGWSPVSLLRLQAVSELGWGPKIVTLTVTGGDTNSRVFQFIRLSEGLLANIEVPVGATGNTRLTAGGGGLIHYLRFEEWRDTTFGFRVQAGVAIQSRGPRLDVLVMFDRARTLVPRPGAPPFALDYSSLLAGGMVTFDLIR